MSTSQVTPANEEEVWQGRTFYQGYLPNWKEELFSIVEIVPEMPPLYTLQDFMGKELVGSFYRQELQRVNKADSRYWIEEVLDEEHPKEGGSMVVKARWLGYPPPKKKNSALSGTRS